VALIDEIDRMGGRGLDSGQGLASFLSILSGAANEKYKRIKVIATTNSI